MSTFARNWIALGLVVLGVLAADQLSKFAVEKHTPIGAHRIVIPGLVNLVHTSNTGVAFGLFADSNSHWMAPALIVFSVVVIVLLVWLLATGRAGGWLGECGLALILGGATGFVDLHLGNYHWYTFNLADSAIVLGAALVVLELLRDWQHHSQEHERA